jgi:Protein of unknown function (DUF2953)
MAVLLVLGVLLGLLLVLMLLPVEVAFRVDSVQPVQAQVRVRALLGLVRAEQCFPRAQAPRPAPAAVRPPTPARPRRSPAPLLAMLREAAFRRRTFRFVDDLLTATHLRRFVLHARLGLGDPAQTGCLWALLGPLSAWARARQAADVRIDPDFVDAVFELQTEGRMRVVPLQVLMLTLGFLLSPPSIQAWRRLRAQRA